MPAANVSYFENLWKRETGKMKGVKDILVVAIIFVGMVMYPAGPEVH
jgi:hypothetical protein